MQKQDYNSLIHILLKMGKEMMKCGAEIYRVEQTLGMMAHAYGVSHANVFAIRSSIVITIEVEGIGVLTETRRVTANGSTDLSKIEEYNALSRECNDNPIPLNELESRIETISKVNNNVKFYIGSAIAAGSFAVFFGGSFVDGIVAAMAAFVICLLQNKFAPLCPNSLIFNFVASLVSGALICAVCLLVKNISQENIISGALMLLIPGISITNALRDALMGDTVSGSMRVIECVLWTVGIAAGFMIPVYVMGVIV